MNKETTWVPQVPVPNDAPAPTLEHRFLGKPAAAYCYKTKVGETAGYICRFNTGDGAKEFRPYSYGSIDGIPGWHWKGLSEAIPLYNVNQLTNRSDAPVLVVEGEKTADAAASYFPDFVVVTTMFGAKSPGKSDWTALEGREVFVWPDNDEAGKTYAISVSKLLLKACAKAVRIIKVPGDFPSKWDLADIIPFGFDRESLDKLIKEAESYPPQTDSAPVAQDQDGIPVQFRLTKQHVEYQDYTDVETDWVPICSRLVIQALTRNSDGENWGRFLTLIDADGREHSWAMPMKMLSGEGSEYRSHLLDLGLLIEPSKKARDRLHQYIASCTPQRRLLAVSRIGWHENGTTFVLPDKTFGTASVVLQQESISNNVFKVSGSLHTWQDSVSKYAEGNSRLITSLCAAFAAPLLKIIGAESGGFHLEGPSSLGKSTAAIVAGSVWGGGGLNGYQTQWRATVNGLEGVAANRCDALLCLDEIGQAKAEAVGEAAYMLSNGAGKARADRAGGPRMPFEWRLIFISTGEKSLAAYLKEGLRATTSTAGQEVRIVNIPADAGKGLGLYEELHGFSCGGELSDHLKRAARLNYGVAIREFLSQLSSRDHELLANTLREDMARFLRDLKIVGTDGQVQRVAHRFALLEAAGKLATSLGVLPWQKDTADWGIRVCFRAWLNQRGGSGSHEQKRLLSHVRLFFEQHGEARFSPMGADGEGPHRPTMNRAGFRRNGPNSIEFFVLPTVFREELCAGFDYKWASKILIEAGLLLPGEKGRPSSNHRLPESKKTSRCYRFSSKVLEGEDDYPDQVNVTGNTRKPGNTTEISIKSAAIVAADAFVSVEAQLGTGNKLQQCSQAIPTISQRAAPTSPNESSIVTNVPAVPLATITDSTGQDAIGAFNGCFANAQKAGASSEPNMSDLSIRCINWLGGWQVFCEKAGTADQDDLRNEFVKLYEEFAAIEKTGFYERRSSPVIQGTSGSQGFFPSAKFCSPKANGVEFDY